MARIYIGKNYEKQASPVQSIFRLAGSGEDALTYAFGYLLANDSEFCKSVLQRFGIRLGRSFSREYAVRLQEVTAKGYGRRDIVIEGGGGRIVIEAKIGDDEPTVEQLLKYAAQSDLWGQYDKSKRWIVALTQVELSKATNKEVRSKLCKEGIRFSNVQWHQIVDLVLRYRTSHDSDVTRHLFNEFIRFIRSDYRMGYHDAEVFVQDVNCLNERIFKEAWMYLGTSKDKKAPLYFAPYFTRKGAKGITMISRVMGAHLGKPAELDKVEDAIYAPSKEHQSKWRAGLCEIRTFNLPGDKTYRLLFLDEPIKFRATPLTKKAFREISPSLPKTIPNQIPKGFSLGVDELLKGSLMASQ